MKRKYFYNYTANKQGVYDKFRHGVISVDGDDEEDIHSYVLADARKNYPDADNINITALNKL